VGWGACSSLGSSILEGCELGFGELVAFTLGVQTLLEAVDSLEQGLENVRLGPALLGHGIVDTRAVEDLACLAGWTGAVALDLAGRSVVWWWWWWWCVGMERERERERERKEQDKKGRRKVATKERKKAPCVCGSSCSSWPREARWRRGGQAGGQCQSGAGTLWRRLTERARPRQTRTWGRGRGRGLEATAAAAAAA
jgi:hypothetical protein